MFFNIVFLLEILNILINNFAVYSFRLQQMIQIDNERVGRSNVGAGFKPAPTLNNRPAKRVLPELRQILRFFERFEHQHFVMWKHLPATIGRCFFTAALSYTKASK